MNAPTPNSSATPALADFSIWQARVEALEAENARLRNALEAGRIGSFSVDPASGDTSAYTPEYRALHGLPPGTTSETYAQWLAHIHPADRAHADQAMSDALATRSQDYQDEFRVEWPQTGETHWIASRGSALEADTLTGTPAHMAVAQHDVTERRSIEDALRESEANYRWAADLSPQVPWMADPAGRIIDVGERWQTLTGMTREETLAGEWVHTIHPDDIERMQAAWSTALASGEPYDIEHRIRLKDGLYRWIRARATARRDAQGRILRWYGTTEDIHAYHEAQMALAESSARFQAAVEAVSGIVWTNSATGEMRGEQPGWASLTGQTQDEYQGFGWARVVHPDDAQPTIDAWSQAVAERRPFVFEHRLRQHDGVWRHFAIRAVPVVDPCGTIREWVGVHTDITEQRVTEQALRDETHTLEVLNQTGAAVAAELDLTKIVQKVTDAATELSGAAFGAFFYNVINESREAYTLYTISGVPHETFSKFPMPRNTTVFAPTFNGEGILRCDDITQDPRYGHNAPHKGMPEGHLPVRSYLAVPVVSRTGEVIGGLFFGHSKTGAFTERAERIVAGIASQAAIAIDNARLFQSAQQEVTARKAAENNLRQLNETLEQLVEERTAALLREVEERRKAEEALRQGEKLAALGQLTGGIAHDFNNIIQVVASGATLLRYPNLPDARRATILDGLTKAAESAKELTGHLLAFARKQALQPEVFDLNVRLSGMAELLRHTLGSRVRVETNFASDVWPVMADPAQLEVAVLNLAVNARDAMLPEGGLLRLRTYNTRLEGTSERTGGEYACLAVTDTGKGMSPAVLARVFEPFFTTKGPDKGTGLGLAQAHGFVKQTGGDITIESTPGQGTTIFLYLPHAKMPALPAGQATPRPTEPLGAQMERAAGNTVLVVDDNVDVAKFAASMLDGLGYTTRRAGNAAEALAILERSEPVHIVFSDVVMPGPMNGIALSEEVRRRYPQTAVVLATGYSDQLANLQSKHRIAVLSKPYRIDELARALDRALASSASGDHDPCLPHAQETE